MEEPPRKELEYSILITLHINPVYLSNPKKVVSDENTGNAAMKTYEKPKISKCTIFACFFVSLLLIFKDRVFWHNLHFFKLVILS